MTSPSKLALIDADTLVYRVGFTTEDKDEGIAGWRLDEMIQRMLDQLGSSTYRCYLTSADKSNFRFSLYPLYKANRTAPKPLHYEYLRDRIMDHHAGVMVFNEEADDAVAIDMLESGGEKILCSIDKDLDQIPGWHFNFVQNRLYNISPIEGWRSFYMQILEGDRTDNIEGCPQIGKVKSQRILEGCQDETEMYESVITKYQNAFEKDWAERLWLAGNLLWIRKRPNQGWERPNGEVVSKESLRLSLSNIESRISTNHTQSSTQFQQLNESTFQTS